MIYLEAGLLAILAVLFLHTSLTDIKSGRIPNGSILLALMPGLVCAVFYYVFFATDCLVAYAINNGIIIVVSLILYSLGIWGAGDCKLLVATVLLFPARLYCLGNRSMGSCFLLIAIIFIISFLYVIADTLYLGIRQKNLFVLTKLQFNWKSYARSILFFFLFLSISNVILFYVLPDWAFQDSLLVTSIDFILILFAMRIDEKVNWYVVAAMGAVWIVAIITGLTSFSFPTINWYSYLIAAALLLFRLIADKYNFKTIRVDDLKPGMILAVGSVLAFAQSKVVGLPQYTSEDLKSRLSAEEVESILRWSKTKNGQQTITIVRKIPFALFIAFGTVLFAVLEVMTA